MAGHLVKLKPEEKAAEIELAKRKISRWDHIVLGDEIKLRSSKQRAEYWRKRLSDLEGTD